MKRVLAILLAVMLAATMAFTTAVADTNPNTFNDEDEVLKVYEYTPGEDTERQWRYTFTYGELCDMAVQMLGGYGYMFWKGDHWRICAVTEFVSLDDVIAVAGADWESGDTLKCMGQGNYETAVTHEELASKCWFFPDADSADGMITVPSAIVLAWDSGDVTSVGDGETPAAALEKIAERAYRSNNLRFAYGISLEQFEDHSAMGARLPQGLSEITIVHPCAEHDWVQEVSKQYRVDGQRTCTEGAWYYAHCPMCGQNGDKFFAEALGHDFSYKSASNDDHNVTCKNDCGYSATEPHEKVYTNVSEEGHSIACKQCDYSVALQPHEFDADGVCICGVELTNDGNEPIVRLPETNETTGGANPTTGAAETTVAVGICYAALTLGVMAA